MSPYIGLTIPAQAEYLDIVRLTLYGVASKAGFSFEDIEDMKVAVAEACNNAILHAYEHAQSGTVEIRFEQQDGCLQIAVKDQGASFHYVQRDSEAVTLHHKSIGEAAVGGLGIFLMQALMDDVQVRTNSGQGTEVVMKKQLAGQLNRKEEMV
ncbi:anti-sigma B factor RsbW [Paenibacillus sp. GCM10023248]|uniref:anti-sigma B factor RsbW n=1 Tax=Bacillales TaxID=1385 RepID=UPI0023791FF0|nr:MULTISPECIES: anti-sigma B factor RsbW [Bacillales]MDD9271014.1 anti-sigma B factor RsbW [Paenibacillus sp. MAHUQ-63]MDR6882849.1 serine/threonine-protein kinase RsbW [Bacillus sp. 3255]